MFIENSPFTRSTVKRVILRLNLIKYQCAGCNNPGHWNNKPLTLQIEHKNGLPNDHRLENLEFLCPNCHRLAHRNLLSKDKLIELINLRTISSSGIQMSGAQAGN